MILNQEYGDMMIDKVIQLTQQENFINLYSIGYNYTIKTVDKAISFFLWTNRVHLHQNIDILNRTDVPDSRTLSKRFGNWGNPKGPLFFDIVASASEEKYDNLAEIIQGFRIKQQEKLKSGLKIAQTPEFYANLANLTKQCFTSPEQEYANRLLDLFVQYTR